MRYYFLLLRRRFAPIRYSAAAASILLTFLLGILSTWLGGTIVGLSGIVLLIAPLACLLELFGSADIAMEDETGHLLPIPERHLVLGTAASLTLSLVITILVEGVVLLLMTPIEWRALFSNTTRIGLKGFVIGSSLLIQGVFAISLLLFLQLLRRYFVQKRFDGKAWPKVIRVLWDGLLFLLAWALCFLLAQGAMVRFPYILDLSQFAIQAVPATPGIVWNPMLWILTPPFFPSVYTQWNLAPLLLELIGIGLFFTLATTIAEDALDW